MSLTAYSFRQTQSLGLEQWEDLNHKVYQQGDILYKPQNTTACCGVMSTWLGWWDGKVVSLPRENGDRTKPQRRNGERVRKKEAMRWAQGYCDQGKPKEELG